MRWIAVDGMESTLGGKINQSLLNLKQLRYLDLSNNNFGGTQIPKFLGSMASLRHLNLSGAGFGGMIPHQFGNLTSLQYLNLEGEYSYELQTESLDWVSKLSSLEFLDLSLMNLGKAFDWLEVLNKLPSLIELHLSGCQFPVQSPTLPKVNFSSLSILDLSTTTTSDIKVPSWIFSLVSLTSLDLSNNLFFGPIPVHLQNVTALRKLDLSQAGFNSSIPTGICAFNHLEVLDLQFNSLSGEIPSAIGNLSALTILDFSYNELRGQIPSAIGNLTALNILDLTDNYELEGEIPSSMGNLTALNTLHLPHNNLEGGIPTSFKNLCKLSTLTLYNVQLNQEINEIIEILSCASETMETLDLQRSQLSGHFTILLGQFKNLVKLDVSENLITGPIPASIGEMTSLTELRLSSNKLNGSLPMSFGVFSELEWLDISHNSLEGEVSEIHFANLTNLEHFDASENHLVLRVNPGWVPSFQLVKNLYLTSWDVGPQFPTWLRYLNHLETLDLSNSKISSTMPIWFNNFSSALESFNLSHNQLHGKIQNLSTAGPTGIFDPYKLFSTIDLSSNYFEGLLPYISSNVRLLDLSNNSFSGSMTNFLCHKMHEPLVIRVLNVGENFLPGEIPDCWKNWRFFEIIKLSNNYLSGNIPESIGILSGLGILDIRNNNLVGELPSSVLNDESLEVLDLSENDLGGEFPSLTSEQVVILNLRGNKFQGVIPEELCRMTSLQILDLADNNLSGSIPKCIGNITAMSNINRKDDQQGTIYTGTGFLMNLLIMKDGRMQEYSTILNFVRNLDLSNNQLSGEIPNEITSLQGLQFLNLSHNFLTGEIPEKIGAMKELESLDLSQNQISGEIPPSISGLTFLNDLNLSDNKLWGIIPTSTQLQSFNSSSFLGNNLCGPPLTNSCIIDDPNHGIEKGRGEDYGKETGTVDWFYFYVSIAPGFVVGFWGVAGPLLFNRQRRHLYFSFLDRLWNKIWVWFYVHVVRVFRGDGL